MLQKIVNGIAIASGVISLTVVGLGGYVFIRKDAIIDSVKGKVMEAVTEKLGGIGDLGGGLGVDYTGENKSKFHSINYSMEEYCTNIVETLKLEFDKVKIKHPIIITAVSYTHLRAHETN